MTWFDTAKPVFFAASVCSVEKSLAAYAPRLTVNTDAAADNEVAGRISVKGSGTRRHFKK